MDVLERAIIHKFQHITSLAHRFVKTYYLDTSSLIYQSPAPTPLATRLADHTITGVDPTVAVSYNTLP